MFSFLFTLLVVSCDLFWSLRFPCPGFIPVSPVLYWLTFVSLLSFPYIFPSSWSEIESLCSPAPAGLHLFVPPVCHCLINLVMLYYVSVFRVSSYVMFTGFIVVPALLFSVTYCFFCVSLYWFILLLASPFLHTCSVALDISVCWIFLFIGFVSLLCVNCGELLSFCSCICSQIML